VFHALDDLFAVFSDWQKPSLDPDVTYTECFCGNDRLLLLIPCIRDPQDLLKKRLQDWRARVATNFTRAAIEGHHPANGYFDKRSPSFLLPPSSAPAPAPAAASASGQAPSRETRSSARKRLQPQQPSASTESATQPDTSKRRRESGEYKRASVPWVRPSSGGSVLPLGKLVADWNRAHRENRVVVPSFADSQLPQGKRNICFGFISTGCNRASCNFGHLELAGPQRSPLVTSDMVASTKRLLEHEAIKHHFQATQALLDFPNQH
jgi:hypothetical protein